MHSISSQIIEERQLQLALACSCRIAHCAERQRRADHAAAAAALEITCLPSVSGDQLFGSSWLGGLSVWYSLPAPLRTIARGWLAGAGATGAGSTSIIRRTRLRSRAGS